MQKLLAKKLNKKGFTLAELLIVVAIIAVLVAIAIPIFTGALEKARLGVHRSNARNLKSMAVTAILADDGLEKNAEKVSGWRVVGTYNFSTQQFSIKEISATSEAGFGSASVQMGVVAGSNGSIANKASFKMFGVSDDEIGEIGTNETVSYYAEIVPNDISISVNW